MSRHLRRPLSHRGTLVIGLLAATVGSSDAQTIEDYSRAQRALIESAMTQAAARSVGAGTSAVAPSPSPASVAPPAMPAMPARSAVSAPPPAIGVSGVFATRGAALAEVVVSDTTYVLGAGDRVPGTAWRVETVAVDRVVLGRPSSGAEAAGPHRIFVLPALR